MLTTLTPYIHGSYGSSLGRHDHTVDIRAIAATSPTTFDRARADRRGDRGLVRGCTGCRSADRSEDG